MPNQYYTEWLLKFKSVVSIYQSRYMTLLMTVSKPILHVWSLIGSCDKTGMETGITTGATLSRPTTVSKLLFYSFTFSLSVISQETSHMQMYYVSLPDEF